MIKSIVERVSRLKREINNFLAIGAEYTPTPEPPKEDRSSPENAQNRRRIRYYTPERLPHILHAIAADYRHTRRSAARAARPAGIAAEDISAAAADNKSPRRRTAAGVKEKPRREYPDGVSCQSFVVGLVWLLVFSCRAY